MMYRSVPALLFAAFFATVAIAAEPIVTTDLLRLRSVTSIDVARSGAAAVLVVRSIDEHAGETGAVLRNQSHLYLLDLQRASPALRRLTFGDRTDRAAVLSPDGRRIAFLRGGDEHDGAGQQVWNMAVDGGEAQPATRFADGALNVIWSPDGRSLLVTAPVPLDEMETIPAWYDFGPPDAPAVTPGPAGTREAIRQWLADNAREQDPVVIHRLDFQGEEALEPPMKLAQLYLVDPDDPSALPRRITQTPKTHRDAAFIPGGKDIVYSAKRQTGAHPDEVLERSLWWIDGSGDADREILAIDGWAITDPAPSLDGSVIAFLARPLDEPAFRPRRLGIASLQGDALGEPVWLTDERTLDSSVRSFEWMHARSAIVFGAARRGAFPLMTMGIGLLEPAELVASVDGEPIGVHAYGVGGGAVVYATTSVSNPCTVRVRDARGDRIAADLNPWVSDKVLSMPTEGWITRPDGVRVQYWLMPPTGLEPGQRYPLVLEIHGGPSAMWGPGEATMWHEFQLLCSWGFGVVYANPRGSGGYGYEFQKGNERNWGEGPAGDVLAVVDQVLLEDWPAPDRLVVTGGSYGGYLTAWIVGHDNRFKAAVAQRGVYDLTTFFGEGNAWRLVEWAMGGPPWDARTRSVLQRESPFTAVNRIQTPLLILHASNDLRTGVSQSEMLYRALRRLGRSVEYVRYPNASHDLSRTGDPRQRMDRLNRMIEWFDRHVENPRPAPVVVGNDETPLP